MIGAYGMSESTSTCREPDAAVYRACRQDAALLELSELGLLRISGADAPDLLQRVTSQEILGLPVGQGARAAVLSGKGKLLALFEIFRLSETEFIAELPREGLANLHAVLDRFVFAEAVELAILDLRGRGVFGPAALDGADLPAQAATRLGDGYVLRSDHLGVPGLRYWSTDDTLDGVTARFSGLPRGSMVDWHALRIDAAVPMVGLDADEKTIPLEVGLDDACDAEKGCYPGQEIVARIRTYGHVNRILCKLEIPSIAELPSLPSVLYDEDMEAGRLTSCYRVPESESVRALAMLPRVLKDPGTEVHVGAANGPLARVIR